MKGLRLQEQIESNKADDLRFQQEMVGMQRATGDFDELTAATVIQAHWRGRCAREAVSGLFQAEDEQEASLAIQAAFRGHLVRHHTFPQQHAQLVKDRTVLRRLQNQQAQTTALKHQSDARRAVEAKFSKGCLPLSLLPPLSGCRDATESCLRSRSLWVFAPSGWSDGAMTIIQRSPDPPAVTLSLLSSSSTSQPIEHHNCLTLLPLQAPPTAFRPHRAPITFRPHCRRRCLCPVSVSYP